MVPTLCVLLSCSVMSSAIGVAGRPDEAAAAPEPDPAQPALHARPELIAEHGRLVAGTTNTLALTFEIDPHWHMYWPGVNDSGMPASAEFELPEGFAEEAWQWPAPHKRQVLPGEIIDHIYEDRVTVLVPITVPSDAKPGTLTIPADVQWLVCAEGCVLEHRRVELTIDVVSADDSTNDTQPAERADALIREARARVPAELPATDAGDSPDGVLRYRVFQQQTGLPVLSLKAEKAERIAFYPQEGCLPLADRIDGPLARGGALDIQFATPSRWMTEETEVSPGVRGVIEVRVHDDPAPRFYRIALPFPSRNAGQTTPSPSQPSAPNR